MINHLYKWVLISFFLVFSLTGCLVNESGDEDLVSILYSIPSVGTQVDIQSQRHEIINNSVQLSQFLSSISSMTGETPFPDFSEETLIGILSGFGVCTELEITSVKESTSSIVVELTKVFTVDPGLCDPSPEGFLSMHYVMISVDRTSLPISFRYRERSDYRNLNGETDKTLEEIKTGLHALSIEIDSLIGEARCDTDDQCNTIEYGHRACGGPAGYKVYSNLNTDVALLREASQAHVSLSKEYNSYNGTISICSMASRPSFICDNVCTLEGEDI